MFGYRGDEVSGRNISMLMTAPDASLHDEYLRHHLLTGETHVIGIGRDLTIDSTDQGAVSTACGIQGFGTDDVIVRGITSHDIMAEQDGKEIAILWNNWNLYA